MMDLAIGKYMKIFDTDKIDIGRRQEIVNEDGSTGETSPNDPIYVDVPCHLSFKTIDNPDIKTFTTKPKILVMKIECDLSVDLQNNDYVTARKCKGSTVVATYQGNIGDPAADQNRKWSIMNIREDI
ncbi:hypothetical protein [Anaerosinus massiliensis]|uniref:hypothetical protein n=1 Tax=Massilibacillus massiliensis TaxID=1806837 RepID=UPI000DA63971|nr:hypothetical protein [Massilibacillus massiliensis]